MINIMYLLCIAQIPRADQSVFQLPFEARNNRTIH